MSEQKRERDELVDQLIDLFRASLSFRSKDELESILEAMTNATNVVMAQGHGLRSDNNAAIILLSPAASKDDVLEGVSQLVDQIEEHWEDVRVRLEENLMSPATKGAARDKLLN